MRDFIHRFYPYQALKLMLQRIQRQHQRLPIATAVTTTTHSSLSNSSTTLPPPPPFDPVQTRSQLVSYFTALKQAAAVASSSSSSSSSTASQSLPATRAQLTYSHLGFYLSVRPSQIPNSGLGVFLHRHRHYPTSTSTSTNTPTIPTGTIVAFYPGTLYRPGEAIFFNSLQNRYILKCEDGIFVDGKPTGLSGSIFRSVNGRDNFPGCVPTADTTWMVNWTKLWSSTLPSASPSPSPSQSPAFSDKTTTISSSSNNNNNNNNNSGKEIQGIDTSTILKNPLAVGQIVNNGTAQYPPNVRYQELDIQTRNFPLELQEFLPNIWYSGDWHSYDHDHEVEDNGGGRSSRDVERIPGSGGLDRLRTVILVTTRPIEKDEELYSTYIE